MWMHQQDKGGDESEDEFDDGRDETEARSDLEEAERRRDEAMQEVKRLQQELLAHKKDPVALEGGEEALAELCPETYREILLDTHDEEVVRDVQEYVMLVRALQDLGPRRKQSTAFNTYRKCRRDGGAALREACNAFAIPAPLLGEALARRQHPDFVPTPEYTLQEMAQELQSRLFPAFATEEDVQRAMRHMLAMEVAYEPRVRSVMRKTYRDGATLTSKPTVKGLNELDELHRYHGLQYLVDKPIHEFFMGEDRTEFLRLLTAEKEGFLTFSLSPPRKDGDGEKSGDLLVEVLEPLYQPFGGAPEQADPVAFDEWQRFRHDILDDAVKVLLLPTLEDECKRLLRKQASEEAIREAGEQLRELVNAGPYMPRNRNPNSTFLPPCSEFGLRLGGRQFPEGMVNPHQGLEVVAVVMAPTRDQPSFAVSVSRDGAVRDLLTLPSLRFGADGDAEMVRACVLQQLELAGPWLLLTPRVSACCCPSSVRSCRSWCWIRGRM